MEVFEIVVGIFSIFGSIAAVVSVGVLISIKNSISIKGSGNDTQSVLQTNRGKDNTNSNITL